MGRQQKYPNVFNKEQLIKLFETIDKPKTMMTSLIAFACGLRVSEVCHLKVEDIDFEKRMVKVVNSKSLQRTKKQYGQDRVVPLPIPIIPILKKWLDIVGPTTYVFPSRERIGESMSKKQIEGMYNLPLQRAGLRIPSIKSSNGQQRYRYTFHTLRHSYATYLYEKTGDIYLVSHMLGHAQVETTQIYAHINDVEAHKKVDEAFNMPFALNPSVARAQLTASTSKGNPLDVLKDRLAKGEIDVDTYRKVVNELVGVKSGFA